MSNGLVVKENVSDRLETILAGLKEKAPKETEELGALVKDIQDKNLAILGEDESFKLADSGGEIRAFRQVVHLSATEGTLVQPVPGGPFVVSAQGYEKWASASGAITMKPPFVLVGDQMLQNPHAERDPKNGRILAIHCRTIAFRFSSKGIPEVSDWICIFDIVGYRLIDLLGKAKKFPQAFRLLPSDIRPESDGKQTWASYVFDENTILWVNTSHEEALNFYAQIINREKKAMDFAQTFSKRNALKHLSAIQKVPGQERGPIANWALPIICWRPINGSIVKWDTSRYSNVANALVRASGGDTNALMIEASKGSEYVGEDPATTQEMVDIEKTEAEGGEGEAERKNAEEESGAGAETQSRKEPEKAGDPEDGNGEEIPPPIEEPSARKKEPPRGEGPLFQKDSGSPMAQFKALEKANPSLVAQAIKEEQITYPMSDPGALIILQRAEQISKRPKQAKK